MSLNIKNAETHRLVTELAALTGETLTQAVTAAVRERLARLRQQRQKATAAELLAIGRRCTAHLHTPGSSLEHDVLLYDERGLPQ